MEIKTKQTRRRKFESEIEKNRLHSITKSKKQKGAT